MNSLKKVLWAVLAVVSFGLGACGGGGSNPPGQITVAISTAPPTSLVVSTTTQVAATVDNDPANAGVTWAVTCGTSACGSFSSTTTASGAATTYTAPATIPTGNTVTITATSVSDTTKKASATVTITAAAGITVSLSVPPPSSMVVSGTAPVTATVSGDSANGGVTWSVTCGTANACGTFNPTSTASGAATTYTAPSAIPSGNTVTIVATSVTDTTKASAPVNVTITTPILADGNYVYHLFGVNGNGPYFVAGAVTVSAGLVTDGEQDYTDPNGGATDSISPNGSSVALISGTAGTGQLEIKLNTADTNLGNNGVITIRANQVTASHAYISEFDDTASATGSLDLQTTPAAMNAGWAFVVSGIDATSDENPIGVGGILNVSGSSINLGTSVYDVNGPNAVEQKQGFTASAISAPDKFGRVTISLTPGATQNTDFKQFGLSGYLVNANRMYLVEDLNDAMQGTMGGYALGQGANTGTFTAGNVAGQQYAFATIGADSIGIATIGGALGMGSGSGNPASGVIGINDLTNTSVSPINNGGNSGGTWTVDSTGRVTFSNIVNQYTSPLGFQLYLDGNGNALVLGVDDFEVCGSIAFLQQGDGPNAGSYALSAQGFAAPDQSGGLPPWSGVGPVTLDSNLNWTGYTDYTFPGTLTPSAQLSATTGNPNGIFHITGLDVNNSGSDGWGYYPVNGNKVVSFEIDGNQLGILIIESPTPQ